MLPPFFAARKYLPVLCVLVSVAASAAVGVMCIASHTPYGVESSGLLQLAAAVPGATHRWRAVHILAAGCACSRGVAEHLAARGRVSGLQESAVVIGNSPEFRSELERAGFAVLTMSGDEAVSRFHLNGAPRLVVLDPDGKLRYSGGYSSDRNARDGYQEIRIWHDLRAGSSAQALPAYGCAVGRHLQTRIDPLGLKYRKLGVS